jgi:hypothetical protein
MLIYLDESGNFVIPPPGKTNFCCVGAVVIPEATSRLFFINFLKLKRRWAPNGGEIKGSSLSEKQVAQVIDLAATTSVKFFTCGTEMSQYTTATLEAYRDHQADRLVASLTPAHQPSLIAQMNSLHDTMKAMSVQLFVQFILLTELVGRIIRSTTVYFSLTRPRELSAFHWTIDAKDKHLTEYERLWELLCGGLLQTHFLRDPPFGIEGADSSEFDAEFSNSDQTWPDHLPPADIDPRAKGGRIIDLRKLLSESREFSDSKQSLGLQAADIITNAYRRAIKGNLQFEGWSNLGKLMLKTTESAAGWLHFSQDMNNEFIPHEFAAVVSHIEDQAPYAFARALRGEGLGKSKSEQ